jgi:(1->4)-alpha-D-glucan 1-alpha-D-glucosylmutase
MADAVETQQPEIADPAVVALLDQTVADIRAQARLPEATYRLQFNAGFTFQDARHIVPYLHDLGITDCYASPYLKARPGSKHGYDISDHRVLNPEIGSEEDFDSWVQALRDHKMGHILDVVPNHMGIVGNQNFWWNDVLENGLSSLYAAAFDIDWYPVKPALREKVMLPVLGDAFGKVLESQELTLNFADGMFSLRYFDHRFPISPDSYLLCLRYRVEELEKTLGKDSPEFMEYQSILTALSHLPSRFETAREKKEERQREKEVVKSRLAALCDICAPMRNFIAQNVAIFNGVKGDPHSFDPLEIMLNDQAYRLAYWRVAADEINYRRFFDLNDLAALSMEKREVFRAAHVLILRFLGEGKIDGLRVDHIDGLYDPREYLERLQRHFLLARAKHLAGGADKLPPDKEEALLHLIRDRNVAGERPLYVVIEKILGKDEPIPPGWLAHGTTGYEFLNMVNGVFVDSRHENAFNRIFQRATGMRPDFGDYAYQNKFLILQVAFSSELHVLAHQLDRLSEKNRLSRDFTLNSLRHALREIVACFPVYRSYIRDEVSKPDGWYVEVAVAQARQRNPAISHSIFDFVRDMLLLRYPRDASPEDQAEQRRFVGKFQQITSPVMAKGLEDTSFYIYNRLLSLNEVGGDPSRFGVRPDELHAFYRERQQRWPYALSASSTHDTKRSEDVRARLNVLSEMPREWQKALSRWYRLNQRHRVKLEESLEAPDRNDQYHLYQALMGAWPLDVPGREPQPEFVERIIKYMEKAVYEAKVHSSWINPNPAYDDAVRQFVTRILDEKLSRRFLHDFRSVHARVSHVGCFNALAQTVLKIAAPGVPDFYQGCEQWDFSLVDPDNRRPVDYERRRSALADLTRRLAEHADRTALVRELVRSKEDGRIKQYVIHCGLLCRRTHSGLFTRGEYQPLASVGAKAEHVFAFSRRLDSHHALAVVPRLIARLIPGPGDLPLGEAVWQDTVLTLPNEAPTQYRNEFTGLAHTAQERAGQRVLPLAELFAAFPVALLVAASA